MNQNMTLSNNLNYIKISLELLNKNNLNKNIKIESNWGSQVKNDGSISSKLFN